MTPVLTPLLTTARLVLRGPEAGDWPAYLAYRRSPRSTLGTNPATGEIWMNFAAFLGHWQLRGFGRFIIVDRVSGGAIGHVGPFFPEGWQEPELTWTLWDGAREGQGIAFEAAAAARDHAFRDLGWKTAVSYIDPANTRSQALARRLGAVHERTDPGHAKPFQIWRHPLPERIA